MLWRLTYSKASQLFPNHKASAISTDLHFLYCFPALSLYTVPWMCSSAVHEVDVRTISNKGTCTCKPTICSWMCWVRNWEHKKMQNQLSNRTYDTSYTEKTIFWAYSTPYSSCGSHLRFILHKEGNKVLWPIIYCKDLSFLNLTITGISTVQNPCLPGLSLRHFCVLLLINNSCQEQ